MELKPITTDKAVSTIQRLQDIYPLCLEYLIKAFDLYTSKEFEWLEAIFPNITPVPAALLCCTENRLEPDSLHLSIFEVAEPCRGNGRGKQILNELISTARNTGYSYMTLQVRETSLIGFYQSFGFYRVDKEDFHYYRKDL